MFNGNMSWEFSELKKLEILDAYINVFNCSLPLSVIDLTNLSQFFLGYYNQFDGGIHPKFGKLVNLVHLDFANYGLKGNLNSLKSLDISNNELIGGIPNEFSGLHELTLLNLSINRLHGEIPTFIAELPKLEVLKLCHNNFTRAIPSKLVQNGKLTELDLLTNKLIGLVPKSLCLRKRLKILILLNNFLFGSLRAELGQCYTLQRVCLG
ncbi:Leucine-rich repeat domain superfamily [Sesbania bispinosa]|nr:Leucine-rich repeat domain superfamily [Sesbania bispinosa]